MLDCKSRRLFKTKGVGQSILAAAMNTPVSVMETAGEGGAWGIALLAAYMLNKKEGETLDSYLNEHVFGEFALRCAHKHRSSFRKARDMLPGKIVVDLRRRM